MAGEAALPPAFRLQVAGHQGLSHEGGALLVPEEGKVAIDLQCLGADQRNLHHLFIGNG